MIYVDPLFKATPRNDQARQYGTRWSHLITDGEIEELHQFAESIGLHRSWFQHKLHSTPHYDITPRKREMAINEGAIPLDWHVFQEKSK